MNTIRLKKIFYLLIGVMTASLSWAQDSPVKVAGSLNGEGLSVKFLTSELVFPEGVNIYRRSALENEFQKLNETPIKVGTESVSPELLESDPNTLAIKDWLDKKITFDLGKQGMGNFMVTFQLAVSEPLAIYAGIQYDDFSILPNTDYVYEVRKIFNGKETLIGRSAPARQSAYQAEPPLKNVLVNADETTKSIHFKWEVETARIAAVNIYKSEQKNTKGSLINPRPILLIKSKNEKGEMDYPDVFFRDEKATSGKTYFYTLEGIDAFGRPTQPTEAFATQLKDSEPPLRPGKLELENTKAGVVMTWIASPSQDVEGYRIYRSTKVDGPYEAVSSKLVSALTYTDPVKEMGHYYYKVAAVDFAENENKGIAAYVYRPDLLPPAVPLNVVATSDTGMIKLSWDKNTEVDLTGYVVFRSLDADHGLNFSRLMILPQKENYFIDTLPKVRKNEMVYVIAAVDTAGNTSAKTAPIYIAMPDVTPPTAPFLKKVSVTEEGVTITWLPNLEPDLAGYQLLRSLKTEPLKWEQINSADLSSSTTNHLDENLEGGKSYCYQLKAIDETGNVSAGSNIYTASVKAKQDNLAATELKIRYKKRDEFITLNWAATTSGQLKGYMVFRQEGYSSFIPVSPLMKAEKFVDEKIKPGVNYRYKVKAFYQNGQRTESNEESVLARLK